MLKKWLLRILMSLCCALLISVLILATNASGSLKLFTTLTKPFAKTLRYQSFSGTLSHHFVIEQLHITTQQYDVQIAQLSCTWQPLALLHFIALLDQLIISDVHLTIFPTLPEALNTSHAIHVPWWLPGLDIRHFDGHHILFDKAKNHFAIDNIFARVQLTKQKIQTQLSWQNMQLDSSLSWLNTLHLNGSARVLGNLTHYDWLLNLNNQQLVFSGVGTDHDIKLTQVHSALFPKSLFCFAWYQWTPTVEAKIALSGMIDPHIWSSDYHGHVLLDITAQAKNMLDSAAEYQLQIKKLNGVLQGRPVEGYGKWIGTKDQLSWQNVQFKIADSMIKINGVLARTSDLHWTIQMKHLSDWLPQSSGSIFSQGYVLGNFKTPEIHALLDVHQLYLFNLHSQRFAAGSRSSEIFKLIFSLAHLHATVEMHGIKQHGNAQLILDGLAYKKYWVPSLRLNTHLLFDAQGALSVMTLNVWPITIHDRVSKNNLLPININEANLAATFSKKEARFVGSLNSNWGKLVLQSRFAEWFHTPHHFLEPIEGTIKWQLDNLALLNNQWAVIRNLRGAALAQLHFTGTVYDPKINGALQLHDTSLNIVPLNMSLKNIKVSVSGCLNKTLKIIAEADATKGHLSALGEIHQLLSNPKIQLNIFGKEVLSTNLPEYKLFVTPNLHLEYQTPTLKLSGSIFIPKAQIKWIDYQKKVVSLSPDVTYVNATQSPIQFFSDLTIKLGDAVAFHYGGLSGLLRGQVKVRSFPDNKATAVGKISLLQGVYTAYGQSFDIQKGSIAFRGNDLTDPELTIEASKLISNVVSTTEIPGYTVTTNPDGSLTVGILISGPLSHYQVQLFSDPAGLDQTDILSFLILGTPAVNAGSSGGQVLLSAASALTSNDTGQLSPLARLKNQLQETLGLSVNVGNVSQYNTTTQSINQATGLILSKRLSPKLSINYNTGISQAMNQLEARYQINKNWMAQTNSSNLGNGGDIFYTLSK